MAFPVLPDLPEKKPGVFIPTQQVFGHIEKSSFSFGNFIILYTAVFLYYFFSGLTILIRGKLPKGWVRPDKEELKKIEVETQEFVEQKKAFNKYGRVVDLDDRPPTIDMFR